MEAAKGGPESCPNSATRVRCQRPLASLLPAAPLAAGLLLPPAPPPLLRLERFCAPI